MKRLAGHARIYVPTHFGNDGSREVLARCRCGWRERIRFGRQKDAAAYYRGHLEDVLEDARAATP